MRFLAFALALAFALVGAGCTKAPPPGDALAPADATPSPSSSPSPTPSPTPAPSSSPSPSPSPAPSTQPTPASPSPAPPASTPTDLYVNKSGWAKANSAQDPNMTVRITFPLLFGAKNFTVRGGTSTIDPQGGSHAGGPFTLSITDPQGRSLANATTSAGPGGVPLPDTPPASAEPQTKTIQTDASALTAGEYTITLTLDPAVAGDGSMVGDRYALSVYVHY